MKIRNSFIANSSTTSFCMYGIHGDNSELSSMFDKSLLDEREEEYYVDEEGEITDIGEVIDGKDNLDVYYYPYDNYICIGYSLEDIGEDETMKEFKERTRNVLKKYFPTITDGYLGVMEESWRDG